MQTAEIQTHTDQQPCSVFTHSEGVGLLLILIIRCSNCDSPNFNSIYYLDSVISPPAVKCQSCLRLRKTGRWSLTHLKQFKTCLWSSSLFRDWIIDLLAHDSIQQHNTFCSGAKSWFNNNKRFMFSTIWVLRWFLFTCSRVGAPPPRAGEAALEVWWRPCAHCAGTHQTPSAWTPPASHCPPAEHTHTIRHTQPHKQRCVGGPAQQKETGSILHGTLNPEFMPSNKCFSVWPDTF